MSHCNICIDTFKKPVSLPCGHIFCTECIIRTVQAIKPQRNVHPCPTCRTPYNISPLNPLVFPPHVRPFVTPTIRRVYLDSPEDSGESSQPTSPLPSPIIPPHVSEELAKLRGENKTLREHCVLWRRRAELHGAATLGLLDFARMVRDQAVSLSRERDELESKCRSLKRKLDSRDRPSEPTPCQRGPLPSSAFEFNFQPRGELHLAATSLPSPSSASSPNPSSCPPATVEASRLAVAALFDLHSYMPNASQAPQAQMNICQCSRTRPEPELGVSGPSSSSGASPGALPETVPDQSNMDQPPTKRARRDSEAIRPQFGGGFAPPVSSSGSSSSASSSRSGFSRGT